MGHIVGMPKLGVTMQEGKLECWYKRVGDTVKIGDVLFDVETDKAVQEVESEFDGVLRKIIVGEGDQAGIAEPVAIIADADEDISGLIAEIDGNANGEQETETLNDAAAGSVRTASAVSVTASPRAKKLARDKGIDISKVPCKKDRITEEDVLAYISAENECAGTDIPYTGMRRLIGEKLLHSYSTKPHIFDMITVNMSSLMRKRQQDKQKGIKSYSVADYLVMACAEALKQNKIVNSTMVGEKITQYDEINLGYAVATERGLVVPVIKGLENMEIEEMAGVKSALVKKALENRLAPSDMENGTFTISNLGPLGVKTLTAIINEPEAAILAVGALEKRIIVGENDEPVAAWCMDMTMCSDHRVIDGQIAASTLNCIRKYLEGIA